MSTRFYDTDLTDAALAWIAPVLRGAGQTSDLPPQAFSFGSIRINGTTYEYDVVIDRGHVSKRNKKPSKKFRSKWEPELPRLAGSCALRCHHRDLRPGSNSATARRTVARWWPDDHSRRPSEQPAALPFAKARYQGRAASYIACAFCSDEKGAIDVSN